LLEIGNSDIIYESSRAKAREYIRDYLHEKGGIPLEQIVFHTFEWREKKADGRNVTTTTWTGINILVWSNSTVLPLQKQKVTLILVLLRLKYHFVASNFGGTL
jgi:hypothetical protein